jgi:DHA1 family bicyclomycin/chloramphenicol resistance-like MFS transporter
MTSPKYRNAGIILLLGLLSIITPFAIDMYLPAFSRLAGDFGTTTSVISLSLSTYFVGFALGQILYGPLLDRFGRKRPLYLGLLVYILACIGCSQAHSIRTFIVLRFIQALGGCAAQVAALAMVRDFFHARESAKVLSLLFLVIGVSPLLAPTIGSAIMSGLGWRWIFILLASNALIILTLVFFLLPEGHIPDTSISLKPRPILLSFWTILKNPQFITYALAGAFSFAGLFAYVAGSPLIFMDGFHMGAKAFGMVFATLTMGFIGGSQVNVFLLRKFGSQKIFFYTLLIQVLTGIVFFIGVRSHAFGLPATLILFFVFLSCIGLTYPNAAALGLAPFSKDAGSASALLGLLQAGTGALISMGIGLLGASAIVSLLSGTALMALIILIIGRTRIVEMVENEDNEIVPVMH